MNAEEYLDRVKKLDAMIRNKMRDHERWLQIADGFGGASTGDRVQSSRNLHKGSDAIGNYIDIEKDILKLKQERESIIKTIESLPLDEYKVIYGIYVSGQSLKEIAYNERKSYEWVKKHRASGIDMIQAILDESRGTHCS